MNRLTATISIAVAFAAGCGVTQLMQPAAGADAENFQMQIIHLPDLIGDALGPANAVGFRSKMLASGEGGTVSVQDGNVPKHLHPTANEVQYILEGTGTIWFGDKQVQVKPGDLIIIPHGTPHGGTKPDGRSIRAIAIKIPPQKPDDVKLLD
jgi:mannose-6-phosphate isomerase-like protein (cupin superfamily)